MRNFIKKYANKLPPKYFKYLYETSWLPSEARFFFFHRMEDIFLSYQKKDIDYINKYTKNSNINDLFDFKVISFDFYDTIVSRMTYHPQDIWYYVGHVVECRYHIGSPSQFFHLRKRSETAAIQRPDHNGIFPEEVSLDQVYEEFCYLSYWPREIVKEAKNIEIQIETHVLRVREEIVNLILKLYQNGHRLIISSDTYMSRSFIENILKIHNIEMCFSEIYLSSEILARKDTGSLWKRLLSLEALGDPKELVHIGDNPNSDVNMPNKAGIRSVAVANTSVLASARGFPVPRTLRGQFRDWRSGIVLGPVISKVGNDPFFNMKADSIKLSSASEFGYVVFGPLLLGFQTCLMKMVKKHKIKKLFFLSRDGYFLLQTYNFLNGLCHNENNPTSEYLYISRRSIYPAATAKNFEPEFLLRGRFEGTLAELLNVRLGIDVDSLIGQYVTNEYVSLPRDKRKIIKFLLKNKNMIVDNLSDSLNNARIYLDNIGFLRFQEIGIVDTGFSCTIQTCLQTIYDVGISGYYFWTFKNIKDIYKKGGSSFDCFPLQRGDGKFMPVRRYHQIIEAVLEAPHGQVEGYNSSGMPIYRPVSDAGSRFDKFIAIFNGVEEYFNDLLNVYGPEVLTMEIPNETIQAPLHALMKGKITKPFELESTLVYENKMWGLDKVKTF